MPSSLGMYFQTSSAVKESTGDTIATMFSRFRTLLFEQNDELRYFAFSIHGIFHYIKVDGSSSLLYRSYELHGTTCGIHSFRTHQ